MAVDFDGAVIDVAIGEAAGVGLGGKCRAPIEHVEPAEEEPLDSIHLSAAKTTKRGPVWVQQSPHHEDLPRAVEPLIVDVDDLAARDGSREHRSKTSRFRFGIVHRLDNS